MSEPLYILLPVHNRRPVTVRCARLLAAQTFTDFQLVLIDDGSADGTADAVREVVPAVQVIRGDGQWWWGGCMAAGCDWLQRRGVAGDTIIGLMNDDVDFGRDFLALAVRELGSHPETLVLARQMDAVTGAQVEAGGGVRAELTRLRFRETDVAAEINCLPTRGLFLRWRDLERAGGFRPRLVRHYLADYEFTSRAHRRGLKLRVADAFTIATYPDASGEGRKSLFAGSRIARIRLLFSHRFKENPRDWLGFVWTAAPIAYRPLLTLKVLANTGTLLMKCLFVRPAR